MITFTKRNVRAFLHGSIVFLIPCLAIPQSTDRQVDRSAPSSDSTVIQTNTSGRTQDQSQRGARDINSIEGAPEGQAPELSQLNDERQRQQRQGARPVFPQEPDLEFQKFIARSLGMPLPIFGQNLFEQTAVNMTPLEQNSVPAEYIVGPGDELQIQTWGQIDTNFRGVVDRTGSVFIPSVGSLRIAGLRYDQLEAYLRNSIGRVYKNFQLSATLGKMRSIRVLVVGQVRRPGTYTISSLSTTVNALFAAGGPSKVGSMRNIQIRRSGKPSETLDLYDLIARGDQSKDTTLSAGDVIYVPPVGHLVAVAGTISIPAIYELKDHTTLGEIIHYAGGLTDTTDGDHVTLERVDGHHVRKVEAVPLNEAGLGRELQGGDVIRFFPISPRFENAVTLRGNVAVPGRYPWHQGMRISELIISREFLITRQYWEQQNRSASVQQREVAAATQDMAPKTEITRPAAEINWNYAVVQRLDPNQLTNRLVPFDLGKAIERDETNDLVLQPGDVITIFSQADMEVPADQRTKFVRLDGEFKSAGIYQIEKGETLRHLVRKAGGLSENAYMFGAEFTRESARTEQQARLDDYIRSLERDEERTAQTVSSNDPQAQLRVDAQRRLLQKMKELRATGRIVLRLKPGADSIDDLPDIELEDGDRLFVPFRPAVVGVIGSVYNGSSFVFRPGMTVSNYLNASGGVTKDGDKSRVFVIRADGTTISKQGQGMLGRFDQLRMMPGDTLVVPEKLDKGMAMQGLKDWTQVFSQFALGAAAITVFLK
jgi:protein involved in polysaccharide export with SLBB domain